MARVEDLRNIQWAWAEKGDVTRAMRHEEILADNPAVKAAWDALMLAERTFELVLRGAIAEADYE